MAPETADRLVQRFARLNARIERSAVLTASGSPMMVLQFARMIREAQLPERKLFYDSGHVVAWLSEILTPAETERLRVFLGIR